MNVSLEIEEVYLRVSNLVNSFILKKEIEIMNYKWCMYFDIMVKENDIDVFPHAFSQGGVSGMLVKDQLGISLTYNPLDIPFH